MALTRTPAHWKIIGGIGVDAATVGFGDPVVLGDEFAIRAYQSHVDIMKNFRKSLVLQPTMEGCPLPVEVIRDRYGMAVAARMEFVSDVAELNGIWRRSGILTITDGRCVAMDPYCVASPDSREMYLFQFPMRSGHYEAQIYRCKRDTLGLRIVPKFQRCTPSVDDLAATREGWVAGEPRESFDHASNRLDALLAQPRLKSWIAAFFDPNGTFEGQLLTTIADEHPNEITVADLYAITLLDVQVRPHGVRLLLDDNATHSKIAELLEQIPTDEDIWKGKTDVGLGGAADRLYNLLKKTLGGVDHVTASKLLHRKRPRLIPIVDRVVRAQVDAPGGTYWEFFRHYLADSARRQVIKDLRPKGIDQRVSMLRLLDVAIWMTGSESKGAKGVRAST